MATGISKNKWNSDLEIKTSKDYDKSDNSYFLSYEGKLPQEDVLSAAPSERYLPVCSFGSDTKNSLFYGDNLDVLRFLTRNETVKEKVQLIYIDPPYATNSIFRTREQKDSYSDTLTGANYLEFMRERLILLRALLDNTGSIYVHLDNKMVFQVKVLMDEIFGVENFRGFITRKKCSNKNYTKQTFGNISDYILFYSKTSNYLWNRSLADWTDEKIKKEYTCIDEKTGRRYKKVPVHAPGTRNGETGKMWRGKMPPSGKHWQYTPKKLDEMDALDQIYWSANGNPRRKVFLDTSKGIAVQDIWLDVQDSVNQNTKITGYPTEKNPMVLERIIKASSNEGDLVLDCFAGSGTTMGVAGLLKRKWIGIDNSLEAIDNILKRMIAGPKEMGDFVNKKKKKKTTLFDSVTDSEHAPTLQELHQFKVFSSEEGLDEIDTLCNDWKKKQ